MRQIPRLALAAAIGLFSSLAAAAPQLLLRVPGPPASAAPRALDSIQSRGMPMRFNAAQVLALGHNAEVELTLPDGSRHPYLVDFAESRPGGITTWIGRHRDKGAVHRAIVTQGPAGAFGAFSTPDGEFRLIPADGYDVLVDMDLENLKLPPIDLRGDALPPPPGAKRTPATGTAPRPFVPITGVNSVAIPKSTPDPIYEIDLMIVYSRGFATKLGANLMTRLAFLVAHANTTFADSEIAIRLRLVRATEVDYPDSYTTLDAIYAITPSCNGSVCNPPANPAFRDVEPIRERVGADLVSFLRGTDEFGGDGRGYLGSDPPYPGSAYSVVTGCVLACDWVFIHELGHNLGVHHDRPTVAQQAGGTSVYYGGAYSYSFGYAYCTTGTLSCNPYIPPSSGGCTWTPECSTYHNDNFADVMAYFYGTTLRNYRFSNPLIRCAGSSGVEGPCGVAETDPMSANGALSINNLRAKLAALKSTVDPPPPPPTLLGFEHAAYIAPEIATDLVIVVVRQGGSAGTAQVRYRTRDGSAIAGADYTAASGLLTWADGESTAKLIRVPILPDSATEGSEQFYVDLFEPSGSGEVYTAHPTAAVVTINEPWPPNNAMPAGFLTPASDGPWTVADDQAYEGQYSLRSAQVFGSGSSQRSSYLSFNGTFVEGEIVFAYRVSTAGAPRSALQFAVDGYVVMEASGETGWQVYRRQVTPGSHSLSWIVYNYDTTACSGNPSAPGGAACADRVWIDAVSLPLAAAPQASLAFTSSPNPSAAGADVTLTAQVSGSAGIPRGSVSFREGEETIPQCSRVDIEAMGRAVCVTAVLGPGTHTLTAVYLGDGSYAGGAQASLTQTVNGTPAAQSITFTAPADRSVDSGSFPAQASASSGLPVTLASQTLPVCTLSGSTVKLRGVGTCTLVAEQAGNGSHQPATPVSRSFAVSAPVGQAADTRAAPTYESVGLYWSDPGAGAAGCDVRFRRTGESAWTPGLAMWFDPVGNECRGSLVHLAAGTDYEAEMALPGSVPLRRLAFRTWSNRKPVAATLEVRSGPGTLAVTQGGSPGGYVVYQGAPGAVLDAANAAQFNVTVDASFVIIRGLTLRGAQQDAIRIAPGVTDVVIEDNDIAGWGRQRSGPFGVDMDSAIRAICASPTLERVTIQRNRIHEPRYGANSWSDGHPEGPQAITFSHCGGNHVIRHNEISSTADHYYNDIISGEDNFTTGGFPNYDSDIYGNRLSHSWDDAIEAEGGNRNVRVWGNYIDSTTTGIATALTSVGPVYAFRNVYNRNRELGKAALDADARQELFKAGSDPGFADGRRYFFHNTTLQAREAGASSPLGVAFGISGSGAAQPFNNTVSRNNIYHTWNDGEIVHRQPGVNNEFASDMYNGVANVTVVNGIRATPTYAPGHGWQSESGGLYALAAGTPGFDAAVRIANFNDAFSGAAPDVGAAEAGLGPMLFGIAASPGASVEAPPKATPAVTLASSRNPATQGESVTFTAAVAGSAGTATGTVAFRDGSTTIAGCDASPVVAGSATCAAGALSVGNHPVSGAYSGDVAYAPLTSSTLTQVVQPAAAVPQASLSPASLEFGGQSMGTTSPPRAITVTNTGSGTLTVSGITVPAQFAQGNDCSSLAPAQSCTIQVTFTPAPAAGGLNSSVRVDGAITLSSNGTGSPQQVAVGGIAEKSLVTHYYRGILRRDPDGAGKAFWGDEAARLAGLGANANEAWFAMAAYFFASAEYSAFGRDDAGFVTDLYNTFFNRAPDGGGLGYWTGQIAAGMPRGLVLVSFMFSREFAEFTGAIFGNSPARAEVDVVTDFYRGVLARLPDSGGLEHWVGRFRGAQCQDAGAVYGEVESISSQFGNGGEYANRARTNEQYVGDLYNAFLRRGGDLDGVRYWIQQLDSGARSRDEVRRYFVASPEFTRRVDAIVAQGCLR